MTFTGTVSGSGTPTGTVTFKDGSVALGPPADLSPAGVATLTTVQLDPGTHSITAIYSGDASFQGVTSEALAQVVEAAKLAVSPLQLSFAGQSSGAAPSGQNISIVSSFAGVPVTISISTTTGGTWLSATESNAITPALILITANPGSLAAGTHQGTITITGRGTTPPTQTVVVIFTVSPAPSQPTLNVQPPVLNFSFLPGASPAGQPLVLTASGGSVAFTAVAATEDGGNWLSGSPTQGVVNPLAATTLSVLVDPTGLSSGVYSGSVTINGTKVRVVVLILGQQPQLALTETGLTFTAVEGGTAGGTQSFGVATTGHSVLPWTAQASTSSGGDWLSVSPSSGSTDPSSPVPPVEVSILPAGLDDGVYYGSIQISAPDSQNSPQFVTVVLKVLAAGSQLAVDLQPTGLLFTAVAGGASPSAQSVQVNNLTSTLSVTAAQAILGDATATVTVMEGPPAQVVVQPDITGLGPDVRQGALLLLFSDGTAQTVNLLLLVVAPGAAAPAAKALPIVEAAACTPTKLVPLFTQLGTNYNGSNFNVPAKWPTPIEVKVVDDCANLITTGSVVATFSNGDPPLNLTSLGDGRWGATWPAQSVSSAVTITVTASVPPAIIATVQAVGGVQPNPEPPLLGGVVNAASFAPQAPLAPGSLISLFGASLASNTAYAPSLPLPTQLAGSLAVIRGEPLPLLVTLAGQINAQIPYDIPVNTRLSMFVQMGTAATTPLSLTIAPASPGIFAKNQMGTGQGVIVDLQNRLVEPGNPAKSGDAIVIYCTGLGAVDPPVAAGAAARLSPLSTAVNPVAVTIGKVPAQLLFAGLTPSFAGLYQVNVFVPAGVTPGDAVEVQLSVAGQLSAPVTIAVR
ncbi:MAG: Ig-like domain repeat protein [Acidobacteria bacterium]|nr:Ig-like domain repeat protein [Acidobacteriota bacterium]